MYVCVYLLKKIIGNDEIYKLHKIKINRDLLESFL